MKPEFNRNHSATGHQSPKSQSSRLSSSEGSILKIDAAGPKIVAVTSGKGGVGKTNVVANLAVSLSELGHKVVVLDADFGLANLDVLLGLTPRYHLGHVLFGNKSLTEIMIQGPKGIRIIPASSGLQRMSELTSAQRNHLVECFSNLDVDTDYFIIDTAAGISRNVIHFLLSAQEVIVVSAPEPTAIVDAYAVIKIILAEDPKKKIQVLINSVESADDAHEVYCQINSVVKRFLNREVDYLGHVDHDAHVPQAVRSQTLVTHRFPNASSSRCFRNLARRLGQQGRAEQFEGGLVWEKLLNDWVN
ncbi:MAG: MinD/ParA family protein [Acidobacteria bacterium]|nr:MinD/ParA family protein [Acidobacteriota bacterium]